MEHAGTQGYEEQAEALVMRYDAIAFEDKYRVEMPMLCRGPGRILDIGAGTGADAAWFAARGHEVVAVEPVERFRKAAARLHPSASIAWIDDGLPDLQVVTARLQCFDVILVAAVWMHLDKAERARAIAVVADLLAPEGLVLLTLRHGPVPNGRRMFDVSAGETQRLADAHGLRTLLSVRAPSLQRANRAAGVEWTHLVFHHGGPRRSGQG